MEGSGDSGIEGVEFMSENEQGVTNEMRELLKKEAIENNDSQERYIETLRLSLYHRMEQDKERMAEEEERKRLEEEERSRGFFLITNEQQSVSLDSDSFACPPQGSSTQALTTGSYPSATVAAVGAAVSQQQGTAQTGGHPG